MRADRVRVGMRGDQRRIADRGDVPEAAFVQMRQIDQNPQPVAGADQRLAELGQTGAGIGRRRTAERHAVAERIRPAPDRAERAQPRRIQHVQDLEIRVDGLGAFDMKHRRQHVIGEAAFDVADSAADAKAPLRLPLDPEQQRRHGEDDPLRLGRIDGRRRSIAADLAGTVFRCWSYFSGARGRKSQTSRRQIHPGAPWANPNGLCPRLAGRPRPDPRRRAG